MSIRGIYDSKFQASRALRGEEAAEAYTGGSIGGSVRITGE